MAIAKYVLWKCGLDTLSWHTNPGPQSWCKHPRVPSIHHNYIFISHTLRHSALQQHECFERLQISWSRRVTRKDHWEINFGSGYCLDQPGYKSILKSERTPMHQSSSCLKHFCTVWEKWNATRNQNYQKYQTNFALI